MPEVATELWSLTKDYARQETVDPLKGVGRYFGYGRHRRAARRASA